jgi:DNA-binding MarR family transcriptional regulator
MVLEWLDVWSAQPDNGRPYEWATAAGSARRRRRRRRAACPAATARCPRPPPSAGAGSYHRRVSESADPGSGPEPADGFLAFAGTALDRTAERLPGTDRAAMAMVLLLHRVANSVVYDLESTVHRPAGWSWSAFRLLFALWVSGPLEAGRAAALTGMSRAAVSSLAKTLHAAGLVARAPDERDRRAVVLSLTEVGGQRLEATFRRHNEREARWAGLLEPAELEALDAILAKLARAAQDQDWISHRR